MLEGHEYKGALTKVLGEDGSRRTLCRVGGHSGLSGRGLVFAGCHLDVDGNFRPETALREGQRSTQSCRWRQAVIGQKQTMDLPLMTP